MPERILSIMLAGGAIVLFLVLLGAAVYIGVFVLLFFFAAILLTSGAEKASRWWKKNFSGLRFWKQRMEGRIKNCWNNQPEEKSEVNMGEVEIIGPEEYQNDGIQRVLWQSESGMPLTVLYENQAGSVKEHQIWLLKINLMQGGAVCFYALCPENRKTCLYPAEKILKVYDADGKTYTFAGFLEKMGISRKVSF